MNYSKILTYDTANSYGYSVSIWVCGCDRKCKGCFNPEAWDYSYGRPFTEETVNKIILDNIPIFNFLSPYVGFLKIALITSLGFFIPEFTKVNVPLLPTIELETALTV